MPPTLPARTRAGDTHTVIAGHAQAGSRLDKVLSEALSDASRSRLKALVLDGSVRVNGEIAANPARRVQAGDVIEVEIPPPTPLALTPEPMTLDIVHEDDDLIVIDKPAGLVVHPGAGHESGTLVHGLLAYCAGRLSGIGGVMRPGIVHRIDKDTSGLIVVAKTDAAHAGLSEQFAAHSIDRRYIALVWGVPSPVEGVIRGAIARDAKDRKRMAVTDAARGRTAVTRYRVERAFGSAIALVACTLETGRTHQIRVHMRHIGHPLVGDPVYGRATRARRATLPDPLAAAVATFPRQALHAGRLGFIHPTTGRKLIFESRLPDDMHDLIALANDAFRPI